MLDNSEILDLKASNSVICLKMLQDTSSARIIPHTQTHTDNVFL